MYADTLTRSQKRAYRRALEASTRTVQVKARLLDKNEKGLPVPLHLSDGEIVVDTTVKDAAIQTAHLTLYDPEHRFRLSRSMRSDGESWLSKLIQITVGIWVFDLDGDTGDWVWTPEFRGQIITVSRSGNVVEVDCASKDINLLPPAYFKHAFAVKRHTKIHKGIRAILRERGETRFRLRPTTKRLRKTRSWTRRGVPMKALHSLVEITDDQFFYDGSGTPVTRRKPKHPCWAFRDEDLIDYPHESLSRAELINEVVALGGGERKRKDDQKRPLSATARLNKGHALSSNSLSDGKRPLRLFKKYDNIKKRSDLKQRAKDVLKRKAHLDQELSFSVRYRPGLEPLDVVKVAGHRIRLKRYTKPLNLDGAMEINWTGSRVPLHRRGR